MTPSMVNTKVFLPKPLAYAGTQHAYEKSLKKFISLPVFNQLFDGKRKKKLKYGGRALACSLIDANEQDQVG